MGLFKFGFSLRSDFMFLNRGSVAFALGSVWEPRDDMSRDGKQSLLDPPR